MTCNICPGQIRILYYAKIETIPAVLCLYIVYIDLQIRCAKVGANLFQIIWALRDSRRY